jgi:Uma2 family endonuclease
MTLTTTALRRECTLADWEATPDDGRRYELIEGTIYVSPAPMTPHQRSSRRLQRILEDACPHGYEVFDAPVGLRLPGDQMLEPDLVVAPYASDVVKHLVLPVMLVIEIVSPSSRYHDTVRKRAVYAAAGIEHYWLVDGSTDPARFTALRLDGDRYRTVAEGTGEACLAEPLAVRVPPAHDLFRPPG